MTFLIARPMEKAQTTADFFKRHHLPAQALGLLDIVISSNEDFIDAFNLAKPHAIVVTSTYAAQWLLSACKRKRINIDFHDTDVVCVGAASALLMSKIANASRLYIASPENSEGLINAPCLQNITNANIVILKGKGGRTLIAASLRDRNASIYELDVYDRIPNMSAIGAFTFETSQIKCIIATSIEITELLLANLDQRWLRSRVWIVASQRIKNYAHENGINHILLSQGASNQALVDCANQFVKTGVTRV